MNLNGTFTFNGPRETVWNLLQDPLVLVKALPGAKTLEQTAPDQYEGKLKVSIGPLTAAEFTVVVTLTNKIPPASFAMSVDGKGAVGFGKGTASITLDEPSDGVTSMNYTSDVQVGGRIAAVGQRLIESAGRMMMKQALDALNAELRTRLQTGT